MFLHTGVIKEGATSIVRVGAMLRHDMEETRLVCFYMMGIKEGTTSIVGVGPKH